MVSAPSASLYCFSTEQSPSPAYGGRSSFHFGVAVHIPGSFQVHCRPLLGTVQVSGNTGFSEAA